MAASIVEDMTHSVLLLQGLPDQQERLDSITTFKKELQDQLAPKLQKAFQSQNDSQQLVLHKIYSHLQLESLFVSSFCQFHAASFSRYFSRSPLTPRIWTSSVTDSPTDTLQRFYPELHTWLLSLADSLLSLFGDHEEGRRFAGVSSQRCCVRC